MTAAPQLALVSSAERLLSQEEAMRRTGWSAFWLREQAKSGKVIARDTGEIAANGRPIRGYLESSLPTPAKPAALAVVPPPASALGPLFAGMPVQQEARIVLPDSASQAQAEQRLAILRPILEFPETPQRFAALQLADGRPVTSTERMIEYVAATHGQSTRTIKRWLAAYRATGFTALADRIRADKGQSRWFSRHREAAYFAAYLYLNERMSVSFIAEQLGYEVDSLGISKDDLPSRETIRVFLSHNLSPAMKTLAREGHSALSEAQRLLQMQASAELKLSGITAAVNGGMVN